MFLSKSLEIDKIMLGFYTTHIIIILVTSLARKRQHVNMSRDFLGNAKNFRIIRKWIYKLFLYGNYPNDSLIMRVIDLFIKIT